MIYIIYFLIYYTTNYNTIIISTYSLNGIRNIDQVVIRVALKRKKKEKYKN